MRPSEILSVRGLHKAFPVTGGVFKREMGRVNVLNGVDLSVGEGEVFGLVGESGCGKSTLARLVVKLAEPSAGEIHVCGQAVSEVGRRDKKSFYKRVQMIFQDPYSSLNPRLRVGDLLGEMLRIRGESRQRARHEAHRVLKDVGLTEDAFHKHPHEFSGGQRQRIAIARALIVGPRLLIADEPVSALDLSIQSQILALLNDLKARYRLTILFISHDLNTVTAFCDRVAVMYLGRIVESIEAPRLFTQGRHPYLRALLESIPVADPTQRRRRRQVLSGEPPSPLDLPKGCVFHPRCRLATSLCMTEGPPLTLRSGDNHCVACHHV